VDGIRLEEKEDLAEKNEREGPKVEGQFQSWQKKKLDDNSKKLYINSCKISGLDLEISFLARKKFQLGEKEDSY